jgi:hypothetical protein
MNTVARLRVALTVCLVLSAAATVFSDVIKMPDSRYATIQKAILWVGDRDTILVSPGVYYENINFIGKQFVLKSEAGPDQTILMPADGFAPMITCINSETGNCLVEGFTITGYDVGAVTDSVMIFRMNKLASPVIKDCIVRDNHGVTVVQVRDDGPSFRRCLFYNNTGGPTIQVQGGDITLLNCTIDRCELGIYAYNAGVEVRNCILSNMTGWAVRGYIGQFDYTCVWNNGLPSDSGYRPQAHVIEVDPMFVDPLGGNYYLQTGSPCIDAGDPNPFFNDPDGSISDLGRYPYQGPTAVDDEGELPEIFDLGQNYPNPFNPITRIKFSVPKRMPVRIDIYNILGERVKTLIDESVPAGEKVVEWNGRVEGGQVAASGVYFYRLVSEEFTAVRQMILLK